MEEKIKSDKSDTHKKRMKIDKWLTPENLELIEAWARDGLSNGEIADKINISRQHFQTLLKKYNELNDAIENGRYRADLRVENALFKRCLGYNVDDLVKDNKNYGKMSTRHIPADPTCIFFWLKNRKPKQWNNTKQENEEILEKVRNALRIIPGKIMDDMDDK